MNETVSVVMPLYNAEIFVEDSIHSVIAQEYEDWELVIVDDGSEDDSGIIAERYAHLDERITLLKNETNTGAAQARNKAIAHAKGRYIAFLDADDMWYPHKLTKQLGLMRQKRTPFCYASYDVVDELGKLISSFDVPQRITYESMLKTCSVGCLTAIYDTHFLSKRYMPDLKRRQDYALWLNILRDIKEAYGVCEPLARYTKRTSSLSSNKFKAASYQWKVYRHTEKLSLSKSFYYFLHYAFNGIVKYN